MRAFFIGHGSPMNAISHNAYADFLHTLKLDSFKRVLVVSAHWESRGSRLTFGAEPKQIYDFYGFPQALYNVKYAPKGDPDFARFLHEKMPSLSLDETRGFDHGVWSVLCHLFPQDSVQVVALSLDTQKTAEEHYHFARELFSYLDEETVLICSGNLVHNLREIDFDEHAQAFSWATQAHEWFREAILEKRISDLLSLPKNHDFLKKALPSMEHYYPFLYFLASLEEKEEIELLWDEIQNASISMLSFTKKPAKMQS